MISVRQALDRRLDVASSAPVAVAYSGGGDSLALLLMAKTWADRHGRRLIALNVDHGLQPQSGQWTERAAATAERIGVEFIAMSWQGPKPTTGLPAAARSARHRLIAAAARAAGARVVLLGHTRDDQLENALMMEAGEPSGALREWSSSPVWPEGRGLFHLRPLLAIGRTELRAWLGGRGMSWVDDPANDDLRYGRARARARLRDGRIAEPPDPAAEDAALAKLALAARTPSWGGVILPRPGLHAHAGLRLLQIAIAVASGRQALGRPERARAILDRLAAGERFVASLGGSRLVAERDLLITREAGEYARGDDGRIALAPGRTQVWDGRFELTTDDDDLTVRPLRGLASKLEPSEKSKLCEIPAAARGSLPAIIGRDGRPSCPILEGTRHVQHKGLTADRFAAACGLVDGEGDAYAIARMAN